MKNISSLSKNEGVGREGREKLTEFEIISEFNTDLVLNDEEVNFKPNKLINFFVFYELCVRDMRGWKMAEAFELSLCVNLRLLQKIFWSFSLINLKKLLLSLIEIISSSSRTLKGFLKITLLPPIVKGHFKLDVTKKSFFEVFTKERFKLFFEYLEKALIKLKQNNFF